MEQDGEIPLLDADRLDDLESVPGSNESEINFGEKNDDIAIRNIIAKLRTTRAGEQAEDDKLADTAIDLYNRFSDMIRRDKATAEQIEKAAELCGEQPDRLVKRIKED